MADKDARSGVVAEATDVLGLARALDSLAVSDGVGNKQKVVVDLLNWRPEPLEDCPICMVLLHRNTTLNTYLSCCGKIVCSSCSHLHKKTIEDKNRKRVEKKLPPLPVTCPFCRTPPPTNDRALVKMQEKRAEKGDAQAMYNLASSYREGINGLRKDDKKAIDFFQRSADFGFPRAICALGSFYAMGMQRIEDRYRERRGTAAGCCQ